MPPLNELNNEKRQPHGATFAKVLDGRKQPIRGLWIRGNLYYARLNVENPLTGIKKNQRVPFVTKDGIPVQTVAQAMAELKRLQTQRSDNTLPTLARTPKFNEYSARYLDFIGSGQGTKSQAQWRKKKALLKRWGNYIGGLRPDQIKRVHVNRFKQLSVVFAFARHPFQRAIGRRGSGPAFQRLNIQFIFRLGLIKAMKVARRRDGENFPWKVDDARL
jgi:hypothetical protein